MSFTFIDAILDECFSSKAMKCRIDFEFSGHENKKYCIREHGKPDLCRANPPKNLLIKCFLYTAETEIIMKKHIRQEKTKVQKKGTGVIIARLLFFFGVMNNFSDILHIIYMAFGKNRLQHYHQQQ